MDHRIFVTGVSGYLGSAIAARLGRAGHDVHGLTRSAEHAAAIEVAGVHAVIGDLKQPEDWLGILKNCDVAVHAPYDPSDVAGTDSAALEAYRAAAQDGRLRRLLYTSGMWVHGDTRGATVNEETPLDPLESVKWRAAHEELALDLTDDEVQTVVLRAPLVYGEGRGIFGGFFAEARDRHTVTIPGDGTQYWGMVHRDDVADAFRLALEYARGGERYVIADESHHTAAEIGGAIARVTGATLGFTTPEEAQRRMGSLGTSLLTSQRMTAAKARRELGWVPRHTSFVAEAEALYAEWVGHNTSHVPR
jgi:nucleoside-diphosphate-sugar epimerase